MAQFTKFSLAIILIVTVSRYFNLAQGKVHLRDTVTLGELLVLIEDPAVIIVDVRTTCEVEETGLIPKAINIPVKDLANTFSLSAEKFYAKFNISKPGKSSVIVLYSRAGDRSAIGSNIVSSLGYVKVKNYEGGWSEWQIRSRIGID